MRHGWLPLSCHDWQACVAVDDIAASVPNLRISSRSIVLSHSSHHINTQIMAEVEKGTIERIETLSDYGSPKPDPLEKVETIQAVDLENHQAFKGDDSDGKVFWTVKKLLAAAFLSMLYTGAYSTPSSTRNQFRPNNRNRISTAALLHWRHSHFHRRGSQCSRRYRMATCSQHFGYCLCMSIRRLSTGPFRKALYRFIRRTAIMPWLHCTWYSSPSWCSPRRHGIGRCWSWNWRVDGTGWVGILIDRFAIAY